MFSELVLLSPTSPEAVIEAPVTDISHLGYSELRIADIKADGITGPVDLYVSGTDNPKTRLYPYSEYHMKKALDRLRLRYDATQGKALVSVGKDAFIRQGIAPRREIEGRFGAGVERRAIYPCCGALRLNQYLFTPMPPSMYFDVAVWNAGDPFPYVAPGDKWQTTKLLDTAYIQGQRLWAIDFAGYKAATTGHVTLKLWGSTTLAELAAGNRDFIWETPSNLSAVWQAWFVTIDSGRQYRYLQLQVYSTVQEDITLTCMVTFWGR